ncbi:MAG TPA: protein kinase [Thermoanaerobaculia bacterium]|nr:protein kinase [Thermoanaerobaculia bacterium]
MTAQSLDTATIADRELPQKKEYVVEKPRVPLVWKLFGLTALLIAIVVALAIGITLERADRIANDTVNTSIRSAAKLFREFQEQRLKRLEIVTQVLGNDGSFFAYIQTALTGTVAAEEPPADATETATAAPPPAAVPEAAPVIDYSSINDNLLQRREQLGTDVMMLLDDQGVLVARTDQPMVAGGTKEDFYEKTPLVRKIVDDAGVAVTSGVLSLGGKLFHAAVAPVAAGARNVRIGYLINAYAIDDKFANGIAETTSAGAVFTAKAAGGAAVRSSNAPSVTAQQMAAKTGTATVDRSRYIYTTEALVSGPETVGTAIFLRSLDRELAPFKEIENTLLIGGGIALLLSFLMSWFVAKRMTRPIEQLAGIAQAITAGDYSVTPDISRNDEVGILGRSFGKMLNSLRDKVELEELYAQMAEKSEAAPAPRALEPARLDEGTVLVTDLRGLPPTVGEGDAASVISTIERVMRTQESEVSRQDGEVREINGHRLVSVFRGERGIIHAIRAARAINEELATHTGGTPMTIGVGIATGEFVTGSVQLEGDSGPAIVGNAPLLALLFAWHAPNGYAYVSYETAQAAGGEVLSSATREEVRLKWLPQPLPVAALPLQSVTTGMMKSIGADSATMATLRMEATAAGATAPGSPHVDLSLGHLFANRYRIEQILGRGGMGVVYKATDTQLDETVAIKTLPGDVMTRSPEDLERFKREIRLARKITHRNVLRTYDYGEAEGVYFISMEFVRGYTLSELLEEALGRQMPTRAGVGLTRQICRGLQAAHEQGIIHRDIKPQNVLIDAKGEVKLMDFGIARMAEASEAAAMTQAGLIVGTPHYMSPEQVQGKQLDSRSDVYSMGVLMYEMLVGRRPFESSSLTGVLTAHITEKATAPMEVRPDIGREVNAIVMRCLAKDPKDRYADSGALLADLDKVQMPSAAAA